MPLPPLKPISSQAEMKGWLGMRLNYIMRELLAFTLRLRASSSIAR